MQGITAMKLLLPAIIVFGLGSFQSAQSEETKLSSELTLLRGEKEYTTAGGTVKLGVREDEGICFLTLVSGGYAGYGEWVAVTVDNGEYVLTGNKQSGGGVKARARCIRFATGNN